MGDSTVVSTERSTAVTPAADVAITPDDERIEALWMPRLGRVE